MTLPISVIILTKNSEARIVQVLNSVHSWVREILIMDSQSTDNTVELCQRYSKVKVFYDPWVGYAYNKNKLIERATSDWILSLDSDEVVEKELQEEITNVLTKDKNYGYYIPRKNIFLGKFLRYGGMYPDYQLRLFKKTEGRFIERRVHESVEIKDKDKIGYLKSHIIHYTCEDLYDFLKRQDRYALLAAEQMYKENKKVNLCGVFIRAGFHFIRRFLLKGGFLDGKYGFLFAILFSYYTLKKYLFLWFLHLNVNEQEM